MGCKICNAAYSIALYFDIRGHHLSNKRGKPTEEHNSDLVFSYKISEMLAEPSYRMNVLTVDCKISKCGTGCALHLDIWAL